MTERSLQITYRKGRPFAAYLHLSHHTGEKSAKTVTTATVLPIMSKNSTEYPSSAVHEGHVRCGFVADLRR